MLNKTYKYLKQISMQISGSIFFSSVTMKNTDHDSVIANDMGVVVMMVGKAFSQMLRRGFSEDVTEAETREGSFQSEVYRKSILS